MPIIDNLTAEPKLSQVYNRMGFKLSRAEIPEAMKPLVEAAIELGQNLVQPLACYEHQPIRFSNPHCIEIDEAFSINSQKVFSWMEGCEGLYLTAVTLGSALDQKVAELSASSDVTRAFLLNAYGAEAAEALMIELDQHIKNLAREQGFETTKRYSPGYGDWDISAQKDLLGLIKAEQIGIQLTEQYLMIPEKSVSAIIGIRPKMEQ